MKKAKQGVTRDYNDCTQPEISKRGICTCLVKKIQFGKISAQRLVITAEKIWSHWSCHIRVIALTSFGHDTQAFDAFVLSKASNFRFPSFI